MQFQWDEVFIRVGLVTRWTILLFSEVVID